MKVTENNEPVKKGRVIVMDIAALSSAVSLTNLQSAYGVAMLSNALDTAASTGDQLVQMMDTAAMERSVYPYIGGNFDMSV